MAEGRREFEISLYVRGIQYSFLNSIVHHSSSGAHAHTQLTRPSACTDHRSVLGSFSRARRGRAPSTTISRCSRMCSRCHVASPCRACGVLQRVLCTGSALKATQGQALTGSAYLQRAATPPAFLPSQLLKAQQSTQGLAAVCRASSPRQDEAPPNRFFFHQIDSFRL